jgi:hypothetical protein
MSLPVTHHFLERCVSRWGFLPTDAEIESIARQIREGSALVLAAFSRLRVRGRWCAGGQRLLVEVRGMGREVIWHGGALVTAPPTPAVRWTQVRALMEAS